MGNGIYMYMISEVKIIYNKITGNRGEGIGIGECIAFVNSVSANANNEVHVDNILYDLLIKGNIISGNEYAGIYVDHFDSPVTIEWNTILGNGNEGIHLFQVESPKILYNTIMYTFTTLRKTPPTCGILMEYCDGVRIAYGTIAYNMIHNIDILHSNDVIVEHNDIIGSIQNGISAYVCRDLTIQDNKINDNEGHGIFWSDCGGLIYNNIIGYSGSLSGNEDGIYLDDCRSSDPEGPTTISDNMIIGNDNGVFSIDSNPTIVRNYITNNVYGIYLMGAPSTTIIGGSTSNRNYITRNYKDGIYLMDSYPLINFNNIYANLGYGVYSPAPMIDINAENNWWGDISGPGNPATFGVGPGAGDEISKEVAHSPWLVSMTP